MGSEGRAHWQNLHAPRDNQWWLHRTNNSFMPNSIYPCLVISWKKKKNVQQHEGCSTFSLNYLYFFRKKTETQNRMEQSLIVSHCYHVQRGFAWMGDNRECVSTSTDVPNHTGVVIISVLAPTCCTTVPVKRTLWFSRQCLPLHCELSLFCGLIHRDVKSCTWTMFSSVPDLPDQ